jgi:hypothetical protein
MATAQWVHTLRAAQHARPCWSVVPSLAQNFAPLGSRSNLGMCTRPLDGFALNFNVADILQKVQERIAQQHAQIQLSPATIINAPVKASKPHDPRPPRLAVVSDLPADSETKPT